MVPLVLGGPLVPGRPLGARLARAVGQERGSSVSDPELLARVNLARVRRARRLAPIDTVAPPTVDEWSLVAAFHDLVQAAHPGFRGLFRRDGPRRLLGAVEDTLASVAAPTRVGDALSRHTWFARALDVERTDTTVAWWTGSRTFLGTSPPPRLAAWPGVRRVQVVRARRTLLELPAFGGAVDSGAFAAALGSWLKASPLTDLATSGRKAPTFSWSPSTLALVASRGGRTLAGRALALEGPSSREPGVSMALGAATRQLLDDGPAAAAGLSAALGFLGHRALVLAAEELCEGTSADDPADAAFARIAGAWAGLRELASSEGVPAQEGQRLEAVLRGQVATLEAQVLMGRLDGLVAQGYFFLGSSAGSGAASSSSTLV